MFYDCSRKELTLRISQFFFRLRNSQLDKVIKQWDEMCNEYRNNEENIEVIDETTVKREPEPPPKPEEDSLLTSSGIEYNSDVKNRDYNRDEDVLSYLQGIFY